MSSKRARISRRHERAQRTATSKSRSRIPIAWGPLAYPVLLVVLGIVGYANSLHVPFLLDDKQHILREPTIRPPLSFWQLVTHDRPVVSASLAANYAIGRLNVFGYHLFNLGAHVICAIIMYGFACFTLRLPRMRGRFGRAAGGLGFVAAAVFLLHPVQTESVTYVIQRAEILAAIALLAGVWIAAVAAQRAAAQGTHSLPLLLALAVVSSCGLLSKESVVVLPVLFALYDWCFIAEGQWRPMARRWPIYATLLLLAAGAAGLRWWQAVHHGEPLGGVALGGAHVAPARTNPAAAAGGTEPLTPWRYLSWQFGVCLYYLRLILFPDRLCFDCGYLEPWPVRSSVLGHAVWAPALVLAGIAVAAWQARRWYPLLTFCVLGSAVVLAPTSSILPLTDVYVEHRLYVPVAFISLLAVASLWAASATVVDRGWARAGATRGARVTLAAAVLAVLAALTIARNSVYAHPLRLWQDSVAQAPQSERALFNLGNAYARRGQREKAIECYQRLIRLHPGPTYYINLSQQYLKLNRNEEAVEALEQARGLAPTWAIIQRKLTGAYTRVGRLPAALAAAERATALEPLNARGYRLLGDAYARLGQVGKAREAYRAALFFDPRNAVARRRIRALGDDVR